MPHQQPNALPVILLALTLFWIFPGNIRSVTAETTPSLFKGSGSAVYFRSANGVRHIFPNQATLDSWFTGTGAAIATLSTAELAAMPLGGNILFRPGVRLVKIATDPKVYAVSRFGVLRWVKTVALARSLYGAGWQKLVSDVPDAFFADYHIGTPISSSRDFNRNTEQTNVPTPDKNIPPEDTESDGWLSRNQKRRAMQITTMFENSTPVFQYGFVKNLHDGRGYTAGRVGFTTGTGDAYQVVQRYTVMVADNPLAKYLPRLKELNYSENASVTGLEGLPEAWAEAAKDPLFHKAQDDEVDEVYYQPAMKHAETLGVRTALGKAILYDTIIQHGDGNNQDSFGAVVRRANTAAGGTPASGVNETTWLKKFLETRRATLSHAHIVASRKAWAESVDRVDALRAILDDGNMELKGPVIMNTRSYQTVLE